MPNTREKLIELFNESLFAESWDGDYPNVEAAADYLIANGVTIPVRCKDCKYRYTAKSGLILCTQHITMTPMANDFCSYGERRNEQC